MTKHRQIWVFGVFVAAAGFAMWSQYGKVQNGLVTFAVPEGQIDVNSSETQLRTSEQIQQIIRAASSVDVVRFTWKSEIDWEKGTKTVVRNVALSADEMKTLLELLSIRESFVPPVSVQLGPPFGGEIRIETEKRSYGLGVQFGPNSSTYVTWWEDFDEPEEFFQSEVRDDVSKAIEYLTAILAKGQSK